MSKYVDIEALYCSDCEHKAECNNGQVCCDVPSMPTADVVSRSEYEELKEKYSQLLQKFQNGKAKDIILCKECIYRSTDDCPMYYEEFFERDDDGYIELDSVIYDNTVDDGHCERGKRGENNVH